MHLNSHSKWNNFFLFICIFGVIAYLLPILLLQEDGILVIRDSMESKFVFWDLLVKDGLTFNFHPDVPVDSIMNGLPLKCMPSGLYFPIWLFYILKPFAAILTNIIIVHIIAFIGMYLLLKNHFLKNAEDLYIVLGVSLCFATLPHMHVYGWSAAGVPLLLNSFFNLANYKQKIIDYIIICFFPFYSSFVLVGIFVIFCLSIYFVVLYWREKKINYPYIFSLLGLGIVYLIVEYKLVYGVFMDSSFVSHRAEMCNATLSTYGYKGVFGYGMYRIFTEGFWCADSLHYYVMFAIPFAGIIGIIKKEYALLRWLLILMVFILFFTFMHAIWYWDVVDVYRREFGIFKSLDWRRFHYLFPAFWYMVMAVCLLIIGKIKYGRYLVIIVLILQFQYILRFEKNIEFNENVKILTGSTSTTSTYKEFYSERLFKKVKNIINKSQESYRVACIAFPPVIANYNGFYTLDSYQDNYPLEYKHQFRKIMAKELEKNPGKKSFFDCWGSICYILPAELKGETAYIVSKKTEKVKLHNLELDIQHFKSMGGEYILSSIEILNHKETGLEFISVCNDNESVWEIFIYKAI